MHTKSFWLSACIFFMLNNKKLKKVLTNRNGFVIIYKSTAIRRDV